MRRPEVHTDFSPEENEAFKQAKFPSSVGDEPLDEKTEALAREQDDADDAFIAEAERATKGRVTFKGGSGFAYEDHWTRPSRRVHSKDRK